MTFLIQATTLTVTLSPEEAADLAAARSPFYGDGPGKDALRRIEDQEAALRHATGKEIKTVYRVR